MLYKLYISNDRVQDALIGSWIDIKSAECVAEYYREKGYETQIVIVNASDL